MLCVDGVVRVSLGDWLIDYVPGNRLADIRYLGHVVDCVQVRGWDFASGPADQVSRVPSVREVEGFLVDWVAANGDSVA